MHKRAALQARENSRVKLLGQGGIIGQNHAPAWPAQCFMRGCCCNMSMRERARMLTACHKTGKMCHINMKIGADFIRYFTEPSKINRARISRPAGNNHRWLMGERLGFNLIVVDQVICFFNPVIHSIKPFARHIGRRAVS